MQISRQTADIRLGGPDAGGTERGVCSALKCIRGVEDVCNEPQKHQITVTYDAHRVCTQQFETAVRVMGGEVEGVTVRPTATAAKRVPSGNTLPGRGSTAEQE